MQFYDNDPQDTVFNPFFPTIPTFAVRETSVSRTANVGTVGINRLISERLPEILATKLTLVSNPTLGKVAVTKTSSLIVSQQIYIFF